MQFEGHAEAFTTEQSTVSKTVNGKGLAVRIDVGFRYFYGLWRGRRKLGYLPTTSSNHFGGDNAILRKRAAGEDAFVFSGREWHQQRQRRLECQRSRRRQQRSRNDFPGRNLQCAPGFAFAGDGSHNRHQRSVSI